ncbi:MAG: NAD(P)H-binding protein [Devosia sp.]
MAQTVFVSGGSGKLGRRVVELLLERQFPGRIVVGSRTPETFTDLPDVEVRKADVDDPAALGAALDGIDRMLLISVTGEHRAERHSRAVAAAKAAGVKHIAYTSMPNPEPPSPIPFANDHFGTEEAIKATGIPYTILRMAWYAENLLGSLPNAISTGKWFSAAGEGRIAHPAREDCSRAAAGALIAESIESRIFTVTGPVAYTTREIAAIASGVFAKPVEVVDVDDAGLTEGLKQAGLPEPVAKMITAFDTNTRLGRMEPATEAVEQLWGAKSQGLHEFLEANKRAVEAGL